LSAGIDDAFAQHRASQSGGKIANGIQFGMRRWVTAQMKGIDGFGDNLIMPHQHGAEGAATVSNVLFCQR
jgi:hypothetical protein